MGEGVGGGVSKFALVERVKLLGVLNLGLGAWFVDYFNI